MPAHPLPCKAYIVIRLAPRVTSILRPCQPHRGLPPTIRTPSSPQAGAGGPLGPTSSGNRLGLASHRHGLAPDSSSLPCRELHRWSFIPASSGGATSPLPSLPATLLWMTNGFPPCPGLRLVSGTLTFEGLAPSVELLFPIPHLSHRLCNVLVSAVGLALAGGRPSGRRVLSLPRSGGRAGAGFPMSPLPPSHASLAPSLPSSQSSSKPLRAHPPPSLHALPTTPSPDDPAVCFGSTPFLNLSRGLERDLSTL